MEQRKGGRGRGREDGREGGREGLLTCTGKLYACYEDFGKLGLEGEFCHLPS